MPSQATIEKAQRDKRMGKSPSTQAGEFVHDEIEKIRKGKHGARSAKQAIAIGLSEARRAGVNIAKKAGAKAAAKKTRIGKKSKVSAKRAKGITRALKRESTSTVSAENLAGQTKSAARKRGPTARRQAAMKAVRTKGPARRRQAALKAARTREQYQSVH